MTVCTREAPSATAENAKQSSDVQALSNIDWNFPLRVAHSDIEGLHPYPAKFIAELPGALLDTLRLPTGTGVLDPFCGSGTTLVECQKRGIPSVGIDLNPIACLMSRVKTGPLAELPQDLIRSVTGAARNNRAPRIPEIPNLDHWFTSPVQKALAALTSAIATAPAPYRDILRLALSSIVVRVSNQESDTRYAAIEKKVDEESVYVAFEKAALRTCEALQARSYRTISSKVIESDILKVTKKDINSNIGMVITSPPYPNAYEYWLYHKYRMWWLGFDPLSVKEQEIGARAHFFKKNHHTADDFVRQMTKTFSLLNEVVVTGGFACFIVGRSKIHGKIVDNAEIISQAGMDYGFTPVFRTERVISATRKSFNLSHAGIKTETVLVLQREGTKCA